MPNIALVIVDENGVMGVNGIQPTQLTHSVDRALFYHLTKGTTVFVGHNTFNEMDALGVNFNSGGRTFVTPGRLANLSADEIIASYPCLGLDEIVTVIGGARTFEQLFSVELIDYAVVVTVVGLQIENQRGELHYFKPSPSLSRSISVCEIDGLKISVLHKEDVPAYEILKQSLRVENAIERIKLTSVKRDAM